MSARVRRSVRAAACVLAAVVAAACGGSPPGPTPNPGGGGGGGVTPPANTPPIVTAVTTSAERVEVGTPVTLTAVVEDAETPVDALSYAWTFPNGSITGTGSGRVVAWTPAADATTPADFTLTVTVTERYTSGSTAAENKATGTVTVHVNNSPKELAELSLRFLGDFGNSRISPERCVAEFSDSCEGKRGELQDIVDNRHDFEILSSSLRHTSLQIDAPFRNATVHTACSFTSRVITNSPQSGGCRAIPSSCAFGSIQTAEGDCRTTSVYEKGRWWLCTSNFIPRGTLTAFERAFFGIR